MAAIWQLPGKAYQKEFKFDWHEPKMISSLNLELSLQVSPTQFLPR